MARLFKGLAFALFALALSSFASAADRGSADQAVAMVKKAVAYMQQNGNEKAFAAFDDMSNKNFHDRDLYIFVYDMKGYNRAHGINPRMIGKNLIDMKDSDDKPIIRSFISVARSKGAGWVDYKWPNPVSKALEQKSSYIEKAGDLIVGCGIYK